MRKCDKRLEMRLPEMEKAAVEHMAADQGITVSELIRRALRTYAGRPEPLTKEGSACVAALRRRVNALETLVVDGNSEDVAATAGLRQARADANTLLRR